MDREPDPRFATIEDLRTPADKLQFAALCILPGWGFLAFVHIVLSGYARSHGSVFPNPLAGRTFLLSLDAKPRPQLVYVSHALKLACTISKYALFGAAGLFFLMAIIAVIVERRSRQHGEKA